MHIPTVATIHRLILTCLVSAVSFGAAHDVLAHSNAAQTTPERFYTHTAVSGDTLIKIAQRYLVDRNNWALLQKINTGTNPNRIPVGKPIRVPVSAMRAEFVAPVVMSVRGKVDANGAAATIGQKLNEKDKLKTGDDGFVTIKLADGSTLTVQSKSAVEVERARQLANTNGVGDSIVRVESGRIETQVTKQNAAARYEVRTATSNMGVRGTMFRVGSDASGQRGQSEVVEGAVGVTSAASSADGLNLSRGFGTIVEAGKAPLPPVKLLTAPDLSALPANTTETNMTVNVTAVAGAGAYRAQAALDRGFTQLVADTVSPTPAILLQDLPDGEVFVRARAIDKLGLEGEDAVKSIAVSARPFAPALTAPAANAAIGGGNIAFQWSAQRDAASYRLQVSSETSFAKTVVDANSIATTKFLPEKPLASGVWFWRVASITTSGKVGPFGQTQKFLVQPTQVVVVTPEISGGQARLRWKAEGAQRFQFQLAKREAFRDIVIDRIVDQPEILVDQLAKNVYFFRVRVVDDTGNAIGAWSEMQAIEIFNGFF